jgi:hypothetical protein
VEVCPARGVHAPAIEIHMQDRVFHAPARGHRNRQRAGRREAGTPVVLEEGRVSAGG